MTKHARDTQGWQTAGSVGTEMSKGALRYGGDFDEHGWFRAWAVGSHHDALSDYSTGTKIPNEDWWIARAGFRGDWQLEGGATLMVGASAFDGEKEQNCRIDSPLPPFSRAVQASTPEHGGSLVAALERPDDRGALDRLTFSYLRNDKHRIDYKTRSEVLDLDWQRRANLTGEQALTWGLGWRLVGWSYDGGFSLNHQPNEGTAWTVRAFALDELEFPAQHLRAVFGAELEHNDFTGTELQPTARAIWEASARHSLWTAVSRAVRTPSLVERYDYSQSVNTGPTDVFLSQGNEDLESEVVLAYELGWRWRACDSLSLDSVVFYNDLDNLVTSEDSTPFTQGGVTYTPTTYGNYGSATAWGVELGADAVLGENWRLRAALTHIEQVNELEASSTEPSFEANDGLFPETIANLRSYYDLGAHWELDAALYYVDSIHRYGTPSYLRSDLRLGHNPSPNWRFSVGVQNACDPVHPEDGGDQVARNWWFGLTWSQ